jgi:uncharacterized MAPEG superfamily protein
MIRGNRDHFPPLQGVAMRVARAHANLNEALLPFAIVVIAAALLHVANQVTVVAAAGFFVARVAHAFLYLVGATPWRSMPTMLDGLAMSLFPVLYGADPAITGAGAAWLLWVIGVAGVLSLMTTAQADRAG